MVDITLCGLDKFAPKTPASFDLELLSAIPFRYLNWYTRAHDVKAYLLPIPLGAPGTNLYLYISLCVDGFVDREQPVGLSAIKDYKVTNQAIQGSGRRMTVSV